MVMVAHVPRPHLLHTWCPWRDPLLSFCVAWLVSFVVVFHGFVKSEQLQPLADHRRGEDLLSGSCKKGQLPLVVRKRSLVSTLVRRKMRTAKT